MKKFESTNRKPKISSVSLLIGIHLVVLMIRIIYVQSGHLELHSEEAQYWNWSKHLQLSYYSKPPLIAYLNHLSTSVLGDTELGIRINAIIIGFLISMVTYLFCLEIFRNPKKAFWASLLTCAMPFFQITSVFFLTDSPLILFWLLSLYFFRRAIHRNRNSDWLAFGISFGFGILAKYAILFLIPFFIWFSVRTNSNFLRNRKFYWSLGIASLMFLPILVWNFQQEFVGFKHLAKLSGVTSNHYSFGKVIYNLLEYILGQLVLLSPFYLGLYMPGVRKYFKAKDAKEMQFLLLPPILVFLSFLGVAILNQKGTYINWAMFSYATVPILLTHWAFESNKLRQLLIGSIFTIAYTIIIGNLSYLDHLGFRNLIPPKNDPVGKLTGWKKLAQKVEEVSMNLPRDSCFVFATNYHITSEMGFYLKNQPPVYFVNLRSRMTQYDLWPGVEQYKDQGYYGIYVNYREINVEVKKSFNEILSVHYCPVIYRDVQIRNFHIYVLKDFKGLEEQHSSY